MIENPIRVFDYLYHFDNKKNFSLIALMLKSKFDSYPQEDIEALNQSNIKIQAVRTKNPNNPAEMMDTQLITSGW